MLKYFKKMLNLLCIFMEGFFLRWGIIKVYTFLEGLEAQFFFVGNISDLKERKKKKKYEPILPGTTKTSLESPVLRPA